MEKEKVLEIEITKINDEWSAWYIKNINQKILKKGLRDKFYINDNFYHFDIDEQETEFEYWAKDGWSEEETTLYLNYQEKSMSTYLIKEKEIEDLKTIVSAINEKYGIPKRWRAERGEKHFSILSTGGVGSFSEYYDKFDNDRYDLGNYFKTKEQAQKVVGSQEWQNFWAKVRAGEIGND